jgi:phosphoglucomutase
MKGTDGAKEIKALMEKIRNNPPKAFGDLKVNEFRDYESGEVVDNRDGSKHGTGLPKSNVLYFDLTENSWCCARPSGTEPKIKFYMGVKGSNKDDAAKKVEDLTAAVKAMIES